MKLSMSILKVSGLHAKCASHRCSAGAAAKLFVSRQRQGLRVWRTWRTMSPPNMAFFDCGGIRIMLGIPDRPDLDHPASIIYYKVDDIERIYETLRARGVEFIVKPHLVAPMPDYDLWLADFKDSEGNLLALMSEVPREVA